MVASNGGRLHSMSTRLTIALAIWIGIGIGTSAAPTKADPIAGRGLTDGRDAFDIEIPSKCTMATKGRRIDFEVFYVTCGSVDYAGVYVGNFADRTVARSRLLKTGFDWPAEVQVWSDIVPADQTRADAIAASVRVRNTK